MDFSISEYLLRMREMTFLRNLYFGKFLELNKLNQRRVKNIIVMAVILSATDRQKCLFISIIVSQTTKNVPSAKQRLKQ